MHTICDLQKYKDTKNTEILRQRIQKYKYKKYRNAADPGGNVCTQFVLCKNTKTKNTQILIQRIQKCKYKKYRNAADPGGNLCMQFALCTNTKKKMQNYKDK